MNTSSPTLSRIGTSHPAYAFVENLFVDAFPPDERRPLPQQRANVDTAEEFQCLAAFQPDGQPSGFITFWDFGRFAYVEHFATAPRLRGSGIGSDIMRRFLDSVGKPVVLEVEPPHTDMARRRIGFYERLGFTPWHGVEYTQPPYSPELNPLPMLLMASAGELGPSDAPEIIRTLHSRVYGAPL